MIPEQFAYLAVLIDYLGFFPYLLSTLKGEAQPNRVTFFMWALAPFISTAAQLASGVGLSTLVVFMLGLGPFVIFVASFWNPKAYYKLGPLDYLCGVLALLGLALWRITMNPNLAILFSVLSDLAATIPTFVKIYKAPETENGLYYLSGSVGLMIGVLCVQEKNFAGYAFTSFVLCNNWALTLLAYRHRLLRPKPQQSG